MPQRNEGEGNRTAARRYNEGAHKTAERGTKADPQPKTEEERREMEKAEKEGRERAKEVDPAVDRDYRKSSR